MLVYDMVDRVGGEPPILWRPSAYIEDSSAPAEFLSPADIEAKLELLKECTTPARLLERAWLYFEHPLATVDTETDDESFDKGSADLQQILSNPDLTPRDPRSFGAAMLKAYEPSFRLRAAARTPRLFVPPRITTALQEDLATIMLDYLDGTDLTELEHGRLAELLVGTYLIDGKLFPFISSHREEANMFPADNHDYYTLHEYSQDRMRKVPISVKYRLRSKHGSKFVTTMYAGKLALETARQTPLYRNEKIFNRRADEKAATAAATRLAADIMVCHIQGDKLTTEDNTFRRKLTTKMSDIVLRSAQTATTPNYLTNARLLQAFKNQSM